MPVNPDLAIQPPANVLLERTFALADEAATLAFGERFAQAIESVREAARHAPGADGDKAFYGLQVQLVGDLGAGKTTLVRATLARPRPRGPRAQPHLHTRRTLRRSRRPAGELALYHFDLYRFTDPAEWADAGFREYFDSGAVCLVEWPQRAGRLLGVPDLVFSLDLDNENENEGDGRVLVARAYSESGKTCLERC